MKEKITKLLGTSLASAIVVCFAMLVEYGLFILTGSLIAVTSILTAMLTCYLMLNNNQKEG